MYAFSLVILQRLQLSFVFLAIIGRNEAVSQMFRCVMRCRRREKKKMARQGREEKGYGSGDWSVSMKNVISATMSVLDWGFHDSTSISQGVAAVVGDKDFRTRGTICRLENARADEVVEHSAVGVDLMW